MKKVSISWNLLWWWLPLPDLKSIYLSIRYTKRRNKKPWFWCELFAIKWLSTKILHFNSLLSNDCDFFSLFPSDFFNEKIRISKFQTDLDLNQRAFLTVIFIEIFRLNFPQRVPKRRARFSLLLNNGTSCRSWQRRWTAYWSLQGEFWSEQ